jgi:hypothetical protein
MSQRKEYNDRWNAPLVNPAFTEGQYQAQKADETAKALSDLNETDWDKYFQAIKERSEYVEAE